MHDLLSIARDCLGQVGLDLRRSSFIELNRSSADQATVALLAFAGGQDPVAFVKATRDAPRARALGVERENLEQIAKAGDGTLQASVPRVLGVFEQAGWTLLCETATPGTRMKNLAPDRYFSSRRFPADFGASLRLLASLHALPCLPGVSQKEADVAREIGEYRAHHRPSAKLERLLESVEGSLGDTTLVPAHGDYCTANLILQNSGGVAAIDWEYPLHGSIPLLDLSYYLASLWAIPYRRGARAIAENFRALLFRPGKLATAIAPALTDFFRATGIPLDETVTLSAMAWVTYANRKRRELEGIGVAWDSAESESYLPLIVLEEGRSINLEILAEEGESYLLGPSRLSIA